MKWEISAHSFQKEYKPSFTITACYFYKIFCNSREWKVNGIAKTCNLAKKLRKIIFVRGFVKMKNYTSPIVSKNFCDYIDTTTYANKFQCPKLNACVYTYIYTHTHTYIYLTIQEKCSETHKLNSFSLNILRNI